VTSKLERSECQNVWDVAGMSGLFSSKAVRETKTTIASRLQRSFSVVAELLV